MTCKELAPGTLGTDNAAFVILRTPHTKHYTRLGYQHISIRLIGLVHRWDGTWGFPGGKQEPGETLAETAVREMREEIGYVCDPDTLTLVCSHVAKPGFHTHLYDLEVTVDDIYAIQEGSLTSTHGRVEGGNCLVVAHGNCHGLDNLINHSPLAKTVKEELQWLMVNNYLQGLGEW